jgi:hypothetical protein
MKLIKFIALAALFFLVFVTSIGFNVIAHECAHYAAAEAYDLNPEMNFATTGMSVAALYSADSKIASITYFSDSPEILPEDSVIAAAGPIANLIIACFALMFYFTQNRSRVGKMLVMLVITTSLISFGINILPFAPSDGFYIWHFLM